ncbi:MAG: periplasmic heavy metal sensor [Myxococcaceae bacterium]|nr:periplasmic heavy metal sensor [Myxococcaceae bacterium]
MPAPSTIARTSVLVLCAALCLAAGVAEALSPEAGGDDAAPVTAGVPEDVAHRAGIPEAQQQEILRLTTEANLELEVLRKRHRDAQRALDALLRSDVPDEKAVLAQIEAMGAAETAIRKNRVALMLRIRRLLGPALWASLQRELRGGAETTRRPSTAVLDDTARVGDLVHTETTSGTLRSAPKRP